MWLPQAKFFLCNSVMKLFSKTVNHCSRKGAVIPKMRGGNCPPCPPLAYPPEQWEPAFFKNFGPQLKAFMAMVGHAMERGGLKVSENAPNSFFPKINWTVF